MASYLDSTIGENKLGSSRDNLPNRMSQPINDFPIMGGTAFGGKKPVRKNVARRISSSPNKKMTFLSKGFSFMANFADLYSDMDTMGANTDDLSAMQQEIRKARQGKKILKYQHSQYPQSIRGAKMYMDIDKYNAYDDQVANAKNAISAMASDNSNQPFYTRTRGKVSPTPPAPKPMGYSPYNNAPAVMSTPTAKPGLSWKGGAMGVAAGGALLGGVAAADAIKDRFDESEYSTKYVRVANFAEREGVKSLPNKPYSALSPEEKKQYSAEELKYLYDVEQREKRRDEQKEISNARANYRTGLDTVSLARRIGNDVGMLGG